LPAIKASFEMIFRFAFFAGVRMADQERGMARDYCNDVSAGAIIDAVSTA
jgi:hypothetical protein